MVSKKERYLENEFAEYWYENGIVYQVFKPNTHLTLESAQKVVAERMIVSNNIKTPICIDIKGLVQADLKAHAFMASKAAVIHISAGAFIVSGVINKMLMQIFLTIFKPVVPAAPFTDNAKAIEWLEKYKFLN